MNYPETGTQPYETSDLTLASFLRCHGLSINDIRRQGGKTIFIFEDSAQLHRAVLDYANDGNVAVRTFSSTMRDLKAITR